MVNLDPDSSRPAPEVLKAVVRVNQNNAGIYGTVTCIGQMAVGQTIFFLAATAKANVGDRSPCQDGLFHIQLIRASLDLGRHCHGESWIRMGDSPEHDILVWKFQMVQLNL